jgi:uncharacterized protein (DUF1501 family)
MISRRFFIRDGSIALLSPGLAFGAPSFINRALAQSAIRRGRRKILIAIFQRGAMDGLNAVVPYGDTAYYDLRKTIAVPRPVTSDPLSAINLDGFFGLNPALAPFKPLYDSGQLAIVHAVGSPDSTRSHFDAQDYMEAGTPGVKSTSDGWVNRLLQSKSDSQDSPFRAVSMGATMPRIMQGRASSLAINNLNEFTVRGSTQSGGGSSQKGFEALYEEATNASLRGTGRETFEAVNLLKKVNPAQHQPVPGVIYPRTRYGDNLRQIAQLIKSDVGLEVAFTDIGGWDTHQNQGAGQGQLALRLSEFSQGIAALYADLKDRADDVVILTMTEFGRTARENGTRGTDHGHASCLFVLGGSVKGGKVYGKWPGLKTSQLYEGRDLALTTDFRDVFSEIASRHLKATDAQKIFPGYQFNLQKSLGIFSSSQSA